MKLYEHYFQETPDLATKAQATAKVNEYRKMLYDRLKSLNKMVPKNKRVDIFKDPKLSSILKDFEKNVPKTIKWLMKNGIPK